MKKMSCRQLGGACDKEFHAGTFAEMAELSKQHGMEMYKQKDSGHLSAMQEMQEMMKNPEGMSSWLESKKKEFDALPNNS